MFDKCHLCRAIVASSMFLRINDIKLSWGSLREVDNARLTFGNGVDLPKYMARLSNG